MGSDSAYKEPQFHLSDAEEDDIFKKAIMNTTGKMKKLKPYEGQDCPKCGGQLMIRNPRYPEWVNDGDEIECQDCDFASYLVADEDCEYVEY